MHNLKEIKIWHKAIDLAADVYKVVANFPDDERYGLVSQTKRAAVSIASNIAKGAGRNSDKEFVHFLGVANGSSYELQTQLVIANRLELLNEADAANLIKQLDELQKMNYGFQRKLKIN